jgi:hypothetical protein
MLRGREDEVGEPEGTRHLPGDQLWEHWSSSLPHNTATGPLMDTDASDEESTWTN